MSDDWRLRVELEDERRASELAHRLSKSDLAHDLQTTFRDRVVVSRDGAEVFCYADTREQAEAAGRAISALAAQEGWQIAVELRHWHPVAEEWEDPDEPLPANEAERAAEHAEVMQAERAEAAEQGFADFEVRVRCGSRREAEELARRLDAEGIPSIHRWEFVVVAATDEDAANALGERIRAEAPPGSTVSVEASVSEAVAEAPLATPFSPFAVFGGLGG
ncbi:MAG TPA: hypothetical protein VKR21_07280 [Solirubrobacteraceae bacterium]|nr:hypothetical protein [Solirubrobacteraceae bacterium]